MRGRAKPVEAERFALTGDFQRPPPDQSGTQQRRQRNRIPGFTEGKGEARVGDGGRGETAITGVTGEQRPVAEILAPLQAIGARTAGMAQPRYAHALAKLTGIHAGPRGVDPTDDFVAGHERQLSIRQFPVHHMQVSAAHTAREYLDPDLSRSGRRVRKLRPLKGGAGLFEDHGVHGLWRKESSGWS